MTKQPDISGFILAGGKSSRMGTNKAMLEINNESMLTRMIRFIAPFCANIAISGEGVGYDDFNVEIIPDFFTGYGPIAGLYSSLKYSSTEWNLVVSVDSPFLNKELINLLLVNIGPFDCIIPQHSNGVEPLIGLYHKRALPALKKQIEFGDYKLSRLLSALNTNFVDCDYLVEKYPRLFMNLNYPEDYQLI